MAGDDVFGWDVGGAHVKACRLSGGRVVDVVQWPCPLWQGQQHLDTVLAAATDRWPMLREAAHAVTMTGEMVDAFADRADGVARIALHVAASLAPAPVRFWAGVEGWCGADDAVLRWRDVASANWLATACHAAAVCAGSGVVVDIGSTTTDLVAFAEGRVLTPARSDADRLAGGELVYHGVVRTPLCALAPRIDWRGAPLNVMNEFFATTADVYRLTGELDAAHDQQPAADGAAKDQAGSRQRLARMIGLDAADGSAADWAQLARAWRGCQLREIGGQLRRVVERHRLGADATIVSAGCGDFLVPELASIAGLDRAVAYGWRVAPTAGDAALAAWAQVCAPAVAVAALLAGESLRCGS